MTSLDQSELIEAYVAAYNRFDVDGMMAGLSEGVTFRHMQKGETLVTLEGRDALRDMAEDAAKAFAERKQTVLGMDRRGDDVVVEIAFVARLHDGPRVEGKGRSTFTITDGQIIAIRDEAD